MTKSRDPEALLAAYFREGMEVLPDRVVDAVLDEAHRTRQRAVRPWRTQPMFKFGLAAATRKGPASPVTVTTPAPTAGPRMPAAYSGR